MILPLHQQETYVQFKSATANVDPDDVTIPLIVPEAERLAFQAFSAATMLHQNKEPLDFVRRTFSNLGRQSVKTTGVSPEAQKERKTQRQEDQREAKRQEKRSQLNLKRFKMLKAHMLEQYPKTVKLGQSKVPSRAGAYSVNMTVWNRKLKGKEHNDFSSNLTQLNTVELINCLLAHFANPFAYDLEVFVREVESIFTEFQLEPRPEWGVGNGDANVDPVLLKDFATSIYSYVYAMSKIFPDTYRSECNLDVAFCVFGHQELEVLYEKLVERGITPETIYKHSGEGKISPDAPDCYMKRKLQRWYPGILPRHVTHIESANQLPATFLQTANQWFNKQLEYDSKHVHKAAQEEYVNFMSWVVDKGYDIVQSALFYECAKTLIEPYLKPHDTYSRPVMVNFAVLQLCAGHHYLFDIVDVPMLLQQFK